MRSPAAALSTGPSGTSFLLGALSGKARRYRNLDVTLPEHGVLLRADFAVVEPDDETRARLLVTLWPARTDLAAHLPGDSWTASPIDRMATLCARRASSLAS